MDDRSILSHINALVAEEKTLRARHVGEGLNDTELDRTWDLLRQRRAKAEFGDDPDNAEERPASEVETYLQ